MLPLVGVGVSAERVEANTSAQLTPGAARVLVISAPGIGWSSIDETNTPNLWHLLEGSAVGNLTARTFGRSNLAAGYLTFGAGTRATAAQTPLDGAGMEPSERFGNVTAREAFALNTGRDQSQGVLQVGIEPIAAANAAQENDVTIGRLGDALARAGRPRAVIGNGDGGYPNGPDTLKRYVVNGLMGSDGVVPAGRVGADLLQDRPSAPFGVRYDNDVVVSAFREMWTKDAVVMVEGSDLVRAAAFGPLATSDQARATLRQSIRRTDHLVGRLLEHVDLERDAVMLVSPTRALGTVLSAVAVHAPGVPPGLVTSGSTRRPGFVLLADVAPTLLALAGLPRDDKMAGSPFTVTAPSPLVSRVNQLRESSSAALFRDSVRGPVIFAYTTSLTLLLVAAGCALARQRLPRWRARLIVASLSLLGSIPAVYLARLFAFHDHGMVPYWTFLIAASAGTALATLLLARGNARDALLLMLIAIVALLVLDVVTGAQLQLSSAFGYSAIVGIRVAGFGNIAYAMLGSAAILASGLLANRIGGTRGALAASSVLIVALVADVAPFWGSDVGGVLSLVPAFGVTAAMLIGVHVRLTWRTAMLVAVITLTALAGLTALDLSRPADRRTHLGRLAQHVLDDGASVFVNTIHRKADANLQTWSSSEWRPVLASSVLFLVYIAIRERRRLHSLSASVPEMRAAFVGIGTLASVGYLFNDSGVTVPGAVLSITSVSLVLLLVADQVERSSRLVHESQRFADRAPPLSGEIAIGDARVAGIAP